MIAKIANTIDLSLNNIDRAMTVLDAAIEQACRAEGVKAENVHDQIWIEEISYLNKLMTATYTLMKEPVEEPEDIKGAVWQLCKEAQAQEGGNDGKQG